MAPTAHKLGGKDLPHGPLSAYVEGKVKERLQTAYELEAKESGVPIDEVRCCCGCLRCRGYLRQVGELVVRLGWFYFFTLRRLPKI